MARFGGAEVGHNLVAIKVEVDPLVAGTTL